MMIIIRCSAGPHTGFGHLVRCRALAMAAKDLGASSILLGPATEYYTNHDSRLFAEWIPLSTELCNEEDAEFLVGLAESRQVKSVILDDYRVDEAYQLILREAGLHWFQFEGDTKQALWTDGLIDASPSAQEDDYQGLIKNPQIQFLLGPSYAVLRPEFQLPVSEQLEQQVTKVLVTFGGGDDRGAIQFVISTLVPKTPSNVHFLVMSGAHNPRNSDIRQWIDHHGEERVSLHINPEQVAPLMTLCDVAIMAGGTTTYEAACCGLPMILIAIAENQNLQSQAWQDTGAAIFLGQLSSVTSRKLLDAALALLGEETLRLQMSEKGRCQVDGKGAYRVAQRLLHLSPEKSLLQP